MEFFASPHQGRGNSPSSPIHLTCARGVTLMRVGNSHGRTSHLLENDDAFRISQREQIVNGSVDFGESVLARDQFSDLQPTLSI